MSDVFGWALALVSGILLGAFFFGGLWWTTHKAPSFRRPALWFLGSFFLRTTAAAAGFWLISAGQWQRVLLCLAGFILARIIINLKIRDTSEKHTGRMLEDNHETKS